MSDISNFIGKFRASRQGLQDGSSTKVIKRPRDSLVCNQCRKSKLRCDRNHPCSSCVRRDEASLCNYTPPPASRADNSRPSVAEERLAHLESMVKELMQNQATVQPRVVATSIKAVTPPALPHDVTKSDDILQAESPRDAPYVGSTHWSAILDDIQELKAVWKKDTETKGPEHLLQPRILSPSAELIYGTSATYSLQEILNEHLPSKSEVDRLLAVYFQGETYIAPFIHTLQFQHQYRSFWANTSVVNPLWLSILFSICHVASVVNDRIRSFHASQDDIVPGDPVLHVAAAKCLVLGEYHRPQQLALEALGLYGLSKNLLTLDPSREATAIMGTVVRMAYEMGFHRDPDSCGSFTVFESEMRRRTWGAIKQMDLMLSFMLGLPSNICLENCDTKSPRNLLDSDFDVDTKILPESRSEDEATRILFFIVKDRQMVNFSRACRDALSFTENSAAEILALDQQIREMYTTIPDILRTRPLSDSLADAPFTIMTRSYIELIYLKSLCVLHRRYMARGDVFSTQCCVDAGKRIVSQVIELYWEFSPGGQLCMEGWMLSNFTVNDFLLGIMVLCLFLHTRHAQSNSEMTVDVTTENEILTLLQQSHTILVEKSKASRDMRRVSHAVRLTLNSARNRPKPPTQDPQTLFLQRSQPTLSALHEPTASTTQLQAAIDSIQLQQQPFSFSQSVPAPDSQSMLQANELAGSSLPFGVLDPFNFAVDVESIDWTMVDCGIELLTPEQHVDGL